MSHLLGPIAWNDAAPAAPGDMSWIWPGMLAPGNLTLLTGGWKSGKTTLVAMLLDRRRQGGLLLNRPVQPGGTVVVSEEDHALWLRRQERFDFGPRVGFWCRPFAGRATGERWQALLDELLKMQQARGIDLVVIDPLAMFLPGNENQSTSLLAALGDLRRLTLAGVAVLLLHHPAKREPRPGHAARGSGALSACADILLELRVAAGERSRRRRLLGFARYEETPCKLALELREDGCDYAVFADSDDDDAFKAALHVIVAMLQAIGRPCTRQEIHHAWPNEIFRPNMTTLWRWLKRAAGLGLLVESGKGTRSDCFRYASLANGAARP